MEQKRSGYQELLEIPSLQFAILEAVDYINKTKKRTASYVAINNYVSLKFCNKWKESHIERVTRHLAQINKLCSEHNGNNVSFWMPEYSFEV